MESGLVGEGQSGDKVMPSLMEVTYKWAKGAKFVDIAGTTTAYEGDIVRIFNDRGAILAGAVISEDIRPGVIQIATGAWYDPLPPEELPGEDAREGESTQKGALDRHGNPNVLTIDKGTSRLAQGPSAHSALVEVERWEGELPAITVFREPATAQGDS